jgi:hypothetical protein
MPCMADHFICHRINGCTQAEIILHGTTKMFFEDDKVTKP